MTIFFFISGFHSIISVHSSIFAIQSKLALRAKYLSIYDFKCFPNEKKATTPNRLNFQKMAMCTLCCTVHREHCAHISVIFITFRALRGLVQYECRVLLLLSHNRVYLGT